MKSNFNDCCDRLLKDEGGYSNDPDDRGGATNFGITIADYRKYIKADGTPNDVKNMSVTDARSIYKSKYWDALNCDALSSGVDYTVFDYGVNSGLGRPRKDLTKFKDLSGLKLIDAINDERQAFLNAIGVGHNAKFLRGWTSRVSRVRAYSKKLAGQNNSAGPISGGSTLGLFTALSQYFKQHEIAIISGGVLAAILIGAAVHIYKNRNIK